MVEEGRKHIQEIETEFTKTKNYPTHGTVSSMLGGEMSNLPLYL